MESIGSNLLIGYGGSQLLGGQSPAGQAQVGMPLGGDGVGRSLPPGPLRSLGGDTAPAGLIAGFMNVMQAFMNQILQMIQGLQGQQGLSAGQLQQRYFSSASLSSTGDPHDAFNASAGMGRQISSKWDSMCSHNHLITSNAIPGGFNVATTTTPPQANGVTYNQSATVSTNRGNTVVTMGAHGAYSVIDNGQAVSLTAGQTSTLSNGETVALNGNGSLAIGVTNAQGGSISTTLSYNGGGVDVNATANNIELGGYLADKQDGWS